MRLTAKQRKFVDSYIADSNATKAALAAGYSKKTARFVGSENLSKPNIKSAIDERMKRIESDKIAKADEVLQYFTAVLRGEAKETIIVSTPYGAESVDNEPSVKDRMAAGRELLKRYPDNDGLLKAQIDKLTADTRKAAAEADIAEAKAKDIKQAANEGGAMIVDDVPNGEYQEHSDQDD